MTQDELASVASKVLRHGDPESRSAASKILKGRTRSSGPRGLPQFQCIYCRHVFTRSNVRQHTQCPKMPEHLRFKRKQ